MKKLVTLLIVAGAWASSFCGATEQSRPNILFCISDDQSWAHTGANGDPVVSTPAFDRVAAEGLRFTHSYCDALTR